MVPHSADKMDYDKFVQKCKDVQAKIEADFTEEQLDKLPADTYNLLWDKASTLLRKVVQPPKEGTFWRLNAKNIVMGVIGKEEYEELQRTAARNLNSPFVSLHSDAVEAISSQLYINTEVYVYYKVIDDDGDSFGCIGEEQLENFYEVFTQITDESEIGMLLLRATKDE